LDKTDLWIKPGEILLPRKDLDWPLWACVACDQFTSQPRYWEEAAALVGDRPSALRLILPECYLAEAPTRIPKIHEDMRRFLDRGILETGVKNGFVLTVRDTGDGERMGLVVLMDLEGYDCRAGSVSPIRPTEGTIKERIPPRVKVRRGAALDMSHVLMLIDDVQASVIEPLYEKRKKLAKLYDFPLMMGGGHVSGYGVADPGDLARIMDALGTLRSGLAGENPLLYAVGDGNHSLAAAKSCWEALQPSLSPKQRLHHPARFALVELVNIRSEALVFQPIHRLVTACDGEALLAEWGASAEAGSNPVPGGGSTEIPCVCAGRNATVLIATPKPMKAIAALQAFLDAWLTSHPKAKLDYIHGEAALREMAAKESALGFLMPQPEKSALFAAVDEEGVLPRKAFSLGEAHEKRYYIETRRLDQG